MEIQYGRSRSSDELKQIVLLQKTNLSASIHKQERASEGFLTVVHDLETLTKMNNKCPHIIATHGKQLAGYALCMHPDFADEIPVLKPMFKKIHQLLNDPEKYMVMGQICVAKPFRKKGIFRGLYNKMRSVLKSDYNTIITEVDAENTRSLQAHHAIGFEDILVYSSSQRTWHLIRWKI